LGTAAGWHARHVHERHGHPRFRDAHGQVADDSDFLLLLNAHHERCIPISHELSHGGWKMPSTHGTSDLEIDKESVKRNRLVQLAGRSFGAAES